MNASAHLLETQTVTQITHYTERLFSFRVTRPRSLRFRSGEFVMIGLMGENGRPLLRAYSIASPAWDDELEFYSIKVPDGPLTSKLQHIQLGDQVIVRPKAVGTLVHDALLAGERLYLIATGTGIAPFASLLRDPETFERFDEIILTHTCRTPEELAYGRALVDRLPHDPLVGKDAHKLRYLTTTTKSPSEQMGRITDWIVDGRLSAQLDIPELSAVTDRVMICGSIGLNSDMKSILKERGFEEGANSVPSTYVLEKAFVE